MTFDEADQTASALKLMGHQVAGIGHYRNGYAVWLADGRYCVTKPTKVQRRTANGGPGAVSRKQQKRLQATASVPTDVEVSR